MGRTRRAAGRRVDSIAKWLLQFRIIAIPAGIIASSNLAWSLVSRTDRIRTNRLKERILNDEVPKHVSIIMDGNGRWAKAKGLNRLKGHQAGTKTVKKIVAYLRYRCYFPKGIFYIDMSENKSLVDQLSNI